MQTNLNLHTISLNLERLNQFVFKLILCVFCVELILYFSIETLYIISLLIIGVILCGKLILTTENLLYYPVSTLSISFYVLFFIIMPIPATLIEYKPVTYNLHDSIGTFTNVLILELILIITHCLYKMVSGKRNFLRSIFDRYNFFTTFTASEIWVLIIISSVIYAYNILTQGLYNEDSVKTTSTLPIWLYVINLLLGGYYQVLFIFMFKKYNVIKLPFKSHILVIIILSILLFIVGIATNMRTASIVVFANCFFMLIVYLLYFPVNYRKFLKAKFIIPIVGLVVFFSGPFMDISKAMLINRGSRNGVNGLEMLSKTFETLADHDNSVEFVKQKKDNSNRIIWDEEYLSNDILNRFCSVKVLDETLFHVQRIGYCNADMQNELWLEILDSFPGIIKSFFNIQLPEDFRQHTLSDKLYSLSIHSYSPFAMLGGAKIGTLQGLGLALFGYWYPMIVIPVFLIIFFLLDATLLYKKRTMHFSLWFFINIMLCCYYFSDRHYYIYEFRFIMRSYWESIIFYLLTVNIIKRIPFIKH